MSTGLQALTEDATAIFRAGVRRVQAPALFSASDPSAWALAPLDAYETIRVVAMGKAGLPMAGMVEQMLSGQDLSGCVVVPEGYPATVPEDTPTPSVLQVIEGGHPVPTQGSVRGARRILEHADAAGDEDLLIVLISGGGTALTTLPAGELTLEDLKVTYHRMLRCGVGIQEMNAVRKHLTQIGGGQLARAAVPASVGSLVVSDVVGDDMSVIASGPTVPDPTTYADAIRVLYRHGLWHDVPAPLRDHLTEGADDYHAETPGPEARCFARTSTTLLGTNQTALDAARAEAEARGYVVRGIEEGVEGEARDVGADHAERLIDTEASVPICLLWGGETTVTVTGDGKGGRNQEVALGAALELEGTECSAVLLSGGTDGVDGPTDAAGAWATPATAGVARVAGCDPEAHLEANNAYHLFDEIDQLIRTGPTHTNVMDLHIGLFLPE